MENNIKDFLGKIEELNNSKFETICLSDESKIQCSLLTFKQQKELLSSPIDGVSGIIKFQKILNDILTENTGVNLLVSDKLPIILKLRSESIDKNIEIDGEKISLDKLIKKAEKMKFDHQKTIEGVVTVNLEIPTLYEENKVLQFAIEQFKRDSNDNVKNIGNIYTYEIVKFVKNVKFGDNVLEFNTLSVKDMVSVVESLPLSINKDIIKFIEHVKKQENKVLEVEVDGKKVSIDIDVSFFDN